jgi:hypothetical protein
MMIYKVGLKLGTSKQDDDENLSIIDKTKHPTKGKKKYKMERPISWQMKNPPKRKKDGNKGFRKKKIIINASRLTTTVPFFYQYWKHQTTSNFQKRTRKRPHC